MDLQVLTERVFRAVFWAGFISAIIMILFCIIRWDFHFAWIAAACSGVSLTAILAKIFMYNE